MSDELNPREMVSHINRDDNSPLELITAAQVLATVEVAESQRAFTAVQSEAVAVAAQALMALPSETVESLREELRQNRNEFAALCADRDALVVERDEARTVVKQLASQRDDAREDQAYWQEQFRLTCDESNGRQAELDAMRDEMRAEREETWRKFLNLQAKLEERGDAAAEQDVVAEREPRVWRRGDAEPDEIAALIDRQGDSWIRGPHGWGRDWRDPRTGRVDWATVLHFAPLTEVLDED